MQFNELKSLNLEDLDVDELETRLEMAILEAEAGPWICGTNGNGPGPKDPPPSCPTDGCNNLA